MSTFSAQRIALATAETLSATWVICSIVYALLPGLGMNLMRFFTCQCR